MQKKFKFVRIYFARKAECNFFFLYERMSEQKKGKFEVETITSYLI
jgi:hypothetical protein